MIPKSWLKSAVLWINVAIIVIQGLVQIIQGVSPFISPEANVILLQVTVALTTVVNFLMRFKTSAPIVMKTPAVAETMRLPNPK